jgi:suppressor of ftsI
MSRLLLPALLVAAAACSHVAPPAAAPAAPGDAGPRVGPQTGALVIAGGGRLGPEIMGRFLELAGGDTARIAVLPGAGEQDVYDDGWGGLQLLRAAGARDIAVVHTRDPRVADDEAFVEPIRRATGVWLPGGRQWRLTDAYLDTRTHRELAALLARGGVIGGTSAGASVQASFMVRGAPEGNQIMVAPGRTAGFGFLRGAAVDQHLRARNRELDMLEVLALESELLGIGVDESTAVIVTGDRAEVVGQGFVAFYNTADGAGDPYYFLRSGDVFDLGRRVTAGRAPRCAPEPAGGTAPSADLYCIDLVPSPDHRAAAGEARLAHVPTPFGVAVDRDGVHIYDLVIGAEGLPDPASLGDYRALVAWATTPTLDPWIRLGTLEPGDSVRARVALNKFIVMVTAEADGAVLERSGPILLRGMSPSMRMLPLDDPVLLMGAATPFDDEHAHHRHDPDPDGWIMPPEDPRMFMPPGVMALRPAATPFLPDTTGMGPLPLARPATILDVADGDTIALTAGLVRRRFKDRELVMYGFNEQYPGPLLRVGQDATVVVRLHNRLDMPTSVHWHGLRLENRFDGVPHVTQHPVLPGETFYYTIRFPDAGIYWYHPHHREDIQQDLGLYGNLLVAPAGAGYYNEVSREVTLLLDDLLLAEEGLVPYGLETPTDALMGRSGNIMLVNGVPDFTLDVRPGEVVRFQLTNAANARTFNLSFAGLAMKVIGSDVGRFEREAFVENVVLAPAERYTVEVHFERAGSVALENRVQAIDHMSGSFFARVDTLAVVRAAGDPAAPDAAASFRTLRTHDDVVAEMDGYRAHFDRPVDHALTLTMEARGLPRAIELMMRDDSVYFNPVEWHNTMPTMSWVSTGREVRWIVRDDESGLENMDIAWQFHVGDVARLRITNARDAFHAMHHPIHIHGQRFLVIQQNGVPSENLVWKDTMLLPVGHTADILLEITNPGRWMLHCHIAEHMETGMMMVFDVAGEWRGGGPLHTIDPP